MAQPAPRWAAGARAPLSALAATLARWRLRVRQRRELRLAVRLDPRMLRDLGLSRWEAHDRAGKAFWRG
jgi:uncharacterized protein YjiS (DUF1127 family)